MTTESKSKAVLAAGGSMLLLSGTVLCAAALSASSAAARTLDRRGAVHAALAQNPQIAAARAEEAAVEAQGRQADSARWPIFSLTAGVGPSLTATLVPGTTAQSVEDQYRNFKLSDLSAVFGGNLTVIQPIYTFGKVAARQEAVQHGLHARQAQTRMQKADVAFEVARIYEGYLLARDAERFLDETIHWLDSTLQGTETKLAENAGSTTERDVYRLQTAVGLASMGLHQAQAGKAQAQAGLIAYLGLPVGEQISVAEDDLLPIGRPPQDFPALVAMASERRPEIAALAAGQGALNALAKAESAGFAPDIFVLAFLSGAYTPGRDWIQSRFIVDPLNNFVPGALLGLRWQFQGKMADARAQEQAARADVLRNLGRWAADGIPAEIRRAYEDVLRASKDIDVGSVAVGKAKRWMVQAGADYSVGFLDIREVSDAVGAYVALRTAVMQSRFDYNVAMASLSKATGTLDQDSNLFYLAPPAADAEK
jgi:outer membrane protein TolC